MLDDFRPPIVKPLNPYAMRAPPSSQSSTSFESPGSNLIDVPAGIFNLYPYDFSLGNSKAY